MGKKTAISEFRKSMQENGHVLPFGLRMKVMDKLYHEHCGRISDYIQERKMWRTADAIFGENGKVALVWSGMDCDCSQYTNHVHIVDSDWKSIEEDISETFQWADGPCGYYITSPSEAEKLERTSRDLALEAFEDGHPYFIHA